MSALDQNSRPIGKGVYYHLGELHASPLTIDMFSVSPVKPLLIEVIPHTIGTLNVPHRMPIDDNSYNVNGGLTNDTNKTLTPLSVDKIQGFPLLRIELLP